MASCCRSGPCEEMFSPRMARRSLKRYRERGLDELERAMVAAGGAEGLEGARVLEIGGGIGALQAELLDAGAAQGEIVELVTAWEPYARELAREKGLRAAGGVSRRGRHRAAGRGGSGRRRRPQPGGVLLARRRSPRRCRRECSRGARSCSAFRATASWCGSASRLVNGGMRVLGRSYRTFVHPRAALVAAAGGQGLALAEADRGFLWEFVALHRRA